MHLVSPKPGFEDGSGTNSFEVPHAFDLITFPEAFVPMATLLETLASLDRIDALGCIHVGLRPSADPGRHLIAVRELRELTEQIGALPSVVQSDLESFRVWMDGQADGLMFNVGCLFALDSQRRLRVCLHPKLVRSQFESSPLPEHHMEEASLLTLVTLQPVDRVFFSVTIQPLICSDALNLQTDRGTGSPIVEVNREANAFDDPPDHIDVVSIATCTPQISAKSAQGTSYREWHRDFLNTFERAAEDGSLLRHHFATFVLSNFHSILGGEGGGLSGVFQPVDPRGEELHEAVGISCFGQPGGQGGNNRWSTPDDGPTSSWRKRGFIAYLNPVDDARPVAVKIFGFSLRSILRESSPWKPSRSMTRCDVIVARREPSGGWSFSNVGRAI